MRIELVGGPCDGEDRTTEMFEDVPHLIRCPDEAETHHTYCLGMWYSKGRMYRVYYYVGDVPCSV